MEFYQIFLTLEYNSVHSKGLVCYLHAAVEKMPKKWFWSALQAKKDKKEEKYFAY